MGEEIPDRSGGDAVGHGAEPALLEEDQGVVRPDIERDRARVRVLPQERERGIELAAAVEVVQPRLAEDGADARGRLIAAEGGVRDEGVARRGSATTEAERIGRLAGAAEVGRLDRPLERLQPRAEDVDIPGVERRRDDVRILGAELRGLVSVGERVAEREVVTRGLGRRRLRRRQENQGTERRDERDEPYDRAVG